MVTARIDKKREKGKRFASRIIEEFEKEFNRGTNWRYIDPRIHRFMNIKHLSLGSDCEPRINRWLIISTAMPVMNNMHTQTLFLLSLSLSISPSFFPSFRFYNCTDPDTVKINARVHSFWSAFAGVIKIFRWAELCARFLYGQLHIYHAVSLHGNRVFTLSSKLCTPDCSKIYRPDIRADDRREIGAHPIDSISRNPSILTHLLAAIWFR